MRTADPWRDTDVIDERAPRFNQAVTGTIALLGAVFGWPLAWALIAAQLLIGLTLGRRFCLPCLAYYELVQPRFGEGGLEDSRPPRLANKMGAAFLGGAAAAWWLGAPWLGTVLGLLVAALALLAASTGFCAGCEIYRLTARLRGISPAITAGSRSGIWTASTGGRPTSSSPIRSARSVASGSAGSAPSPSRCSSWMSAIAPIWRASTASRSSRPSSRSRRTARWLSGSRRSYCPGL
jgi:Domain of unknown function (DUF4395)